MTTAAPVQQTKNPYLNGNFAPVHEEVTVTDLDVTGTIPDYLDGRYLRTGPNPLDNPDPARYHWFLGTGMAHGLRLRDGKAHWYRNRWVRSAAVARALGEQWPKGPSTGGFDFASNTNIIGHAGKTLVLTEGGVRPYELTDELDTAGPSDFCGTLFGGYSAHPKLDPLSGELHAVSYNPMRGNIVRYTVTGVDGRVRRTVDIRLQAQTMMHDFSLTEHYVVLYDLPVALDFGERLNNRPAKAVAKMLAQFAERHAAPDFLLRAAMRGSERGSGPLEQSGVSYRWAPERPARVGVLPREGTAADIRWFDVQPCYVFHPLNAFDDDDRIVLDVVRYPSVFTTAHDYVPETQSLDRWTVDLTAGKVTEQRFDDTAQEFPRVDERLVGRRHRYGYAVGYASDPDGAVAPNALLKHDVDDRSTRTVEFGPGCQPGEFVFAPAAPDAAEDDGVVMGFVYDRATDRSNLVLLDGQTLETVGAVHLPVRVPHGFHGNWVPSAAG
jgi:carotenoid cleavage oxygenase